MTDASHNSSGDALPAPDDATVAGPGTGLRPWPGLVLGDRYRVERLLGRGGMGEVWQAFDLKLCVEVALKVLRPRGAGAGQPEWLRREVRAAREVVSANVCRIYDLIEIEGHELVSMEYVDGENLREHLREHGPLDLRQARAIAGQLLAGLQAIHEAGLVHRDLKPENVMVTRAGRVVVMDFGIARALAESGHGTIAGTPAYMAPEQARGGPVDARTDVYAAGLVIGELARGSPQPGATRGSATATGEALPSPDPSGGAWDEAIGRAVSPDPMQRYPSARAFALALDETTRTGGGPEDASPYPGLFAFTAENARFFFGRESDVEAVGRRLQRLHLLAVVGPSGVGKSSFLGAGLIPSLPRGWDCVRCAPGPAPFVALGQALGPRLAEDPDALRDFFRFAEPDVAVSLFARWRSRHAEALLVIDQFEELFTQSPPEVEARFAELIGRLPVEAGVRVLLSLRDDFLFRCQGHPGLRPIFTELTPLAPLRGADLRRVLVQPALACGVRFEDESLVDRMVTEVETERGALPLLAFTAARLWERRDRARGLLTREAYEAIGGVAGSLAQHAEATLERIGAQQQGMVRELFRNLVTSQGTRVSREREELLSAFPDRAAAGEVIGHLIDARLLTAYEAMDAQDAAVRRQRLEIVHESLLTHWPRLVRWQTQDADGAQLRDQLRQAARLWEESGRPADLLWTGTIYQEFRLWRAREPGGLTEGEERFAQAMTARVEQRRRRRRRVVAGAIAALLLVASAMTTLWARAQREQRRSEANHLLALARAEFERNPTSALAYATAALDLRDTPPGRRCALEALLDGPPAFALAPGTFPVAGDSVVASSECSDLVWSPDGRWLAEACSEDAVRVWSREGGPPLLLRAPDAPIRGNGVPAFSPRSDVLAVRSERKLRFWSVPGGRLLRSREVAPGTRVDLLPTHIRLSTRIPAAGDVRRIESCSYETGETASLGERAWPASRWWGYDRSGDWLIFAQADGIYRVPFDSLGSARPRLVGRHPGASGAFLYPEHALAVSWDFDDSPSCLIWSLDDAGAAPRWILPLRMDSAAMRLGPTGTLITAPGETRLGLLDLGVGPGVPTTALKLRAALGTEGVLGDPEFQPEGRWFAGGYNWSVASLVPLTHAYPRRLYAHRNAVHHLRFTPDGRTLVTSGLDGAVRSWSLDTGPREGARTLFADSRPNSDLWGFAMSGDGRWIAVSSNLASVFVVPVGGGAPRELKGFRTLPAILAFDRTGRRVAAAGGEVDLREAVIRVWDLATGAVAVLDPGEGKRFQALLFLPDGRLLSGGDGGLCLWDVDTGARRILRPDVPVCCPAGGSLRLLPDGRSVRCSVSRPDRPEKVEHLVWDVPTDAWSHFAYGDCAFDDAGATFSCFRDDILHYGRAVREGPAGAAMAPGEAHLVCRVPQSIAYCLSPDRKLAALSDGNGSIFLVPLPEGEPLQTLPRAEFMARLRGLTNVRAVRDPRERDGYRLEAGTFPGWAGTPEW